MALHTSQEHDDFRGISLCAGVGGLDLGLHLAEPGYRAVCHVERNSFAAATLVARMADTSLAPAVVWDDLKSFDGRPWRDRVHIITAGYPCQPFTYSGHRKGEDDPRHLWPDVARIVSEARPEWCFFENVPGHLSLGFHDVCADLQDMGYRVAACVVSAAEVGGSHLRERMFILAHADLSDGRQPDVDQNGAKPVPIQRGPKSKGNPSRSARRSTGLDLDVGDAGGDGLDTRTARLFPPVPGNLDEWGRALDGGIRSQPVLHRLDHGLANRMDRSYASGNGVVPMAAARAWVWLKEALNQSVS
ncbi:MAG: DNA cytosine methyltransferase [Octadecabacter sp.]